MSALDEPGAGGGKPPLYEKCTKCGREKGGESHCPVGYDYSCPWCAECGARIGRGGR